MAVLQLLFGGGLGVLLLTGRTNRWLPTLRPLLGLANNDVVTFRAGHGALDQQKIVRLADLDDLEVLRRAGDLAHVTRHAHAAHDRAWEQALTDRSGATMPALR